MSKKDLRPSGWNFAFVPKDVFLSPDLSHADVRLYCYLLWRSGTKDNAWPKVETMAKDLSMSYAAVKLSLKSLLKNNWIIRERNFKGSSTTWIFEKQEDCLTANRLAHVRLTGEPSDGLQDSRLKESQVKENHIKRGGANAQKAKRPPKVETPQKTPTVEIQKAYEAILGYSLNGEWAAGEGKAAKSIATYYTVEQMTEAYKYYKSTPFWNDKRLSLRYLSQQMGEFVRRGHAPQQKLTSEMTPEEVEAEYIRVNTYA